LLVIGACAALAWVVAGVTISGDYQIHGAVLGDNAGPAIDALVHGHLTAMVSVQPLMGLVSVVWRVPFVALAGLLGGGDRLIYALGCAVCLLPAAGLIAWLVRRADSLTQLAGVGLAAALIVVGPATLQAARVGHPEEVLVIVLATGAVVSASAERRGWAAVLLGLAVGTKQWALLATPCVLLALPDGRTAVAAKAALVAGPATVALPLLSLAAFARADASVGGLRIADPFSLWWLASPRRYPGAADFHAHVLPLSLTRSEAAALALGLAAAAIYAYGRRAGVRRAPRVDGLALLALLGLLRCITDPDPLTYNFVALVIPLAVWEAGALKRLPILTALTCGTLALLPTGGNAYVAGGGLFVGLPAGSILWLSGAVALGCYLALRAVGSSATAGAQIPRWARPQVALTGSGLARRSPTRP
jgi:hypothetical protein